MLRRLTMAFLPRFTTIVLVSLALSSAAAHAQGSPTSGPQDDDKNVTAQLAMLEQEIDLSSKSATATNDAGPAGIVPFTRGFNASLTLGGQHDSDSGWAQTTEPDLAYRFNKHFALNLGIPVYGTVNVPGTPITNSKNAKTPTPPTTEDVLDRRRFLLGDLTLGGSFDTSLKFADYTLTATLGTPTGDDRDGLGAGQFTYSFVNHLERDVFGWWTPELELGVGDSSDLLDMRVLKNYTATGTNAHFQVGFGVSLPWSMEFSADAYENLPLASQTVTSTATNGKKGKQLRTVTTTSEKSVGEDNGFLNTLDIPLGRHLTLSGFYNRSLRDKTDTAGASLTFLLRGTPRESGDTR